MWLITRPFVYLFKLLKTIVKAPFKAVRAKRNHTTRKNATLAATAVKQQQAAAAAAAVAAPAIAVQGSASGAPGSGAATSGQAVPEPPAETLS